MPDAPDEHDQPDTPDDAPRRLHWGWLLLAVVVAVVSFLAVSVQSGQCVDSVTPGASSCTTGPVLGTAGWLVGLAGAGFVIYAVRRGLGRR
ncbi:hypothetical protein EQW78_06370 [Oerskovia turbata]|uniref:Uncharacterized protein n=1 Tax=Oerskovia turbata TaxID=1713 RepID=A0A4Q1KXZ4_9CELL|nr:hypothetical protein [Oerskovia turbata]RXR25077.1 hypothetical protein EQW73_12400 [Oerskovia turbata]RXR35223.1 hypothetical protein EQW78_06370 [Oerskovia turbata]TGJ96460.1 hypothetical protein DLJ96_12235 [Actinotalea fermentans ATCC 43279 = JCM 9966 = DSM 3133]